MKARLQAYGAALVSALRSASRFALHSPRMRWPRRVAVGALASVVVMVVAWHVAVAAGDFPVERLTKTDAASLVTLDASGNVLRKEASSAGLREHWTRLEDISPHLVAATLASEDHDFYEHAGVDWSAIARASWLNLRGARVAFGGSTITMQLVRLTANTRRSALGKLRQAVLAARLEKALSKREILEQYLNRVYYGNGAWGAAQAAKVYFDKEADELSVGEAALLAVLPRGPTHYNPFEHYSRAIRRRQHILELMKRRGYIDSEALRLATVTPINVGRNRDEFRAPHFVELVKERLPEGFARSARVTTTLDWNLQRDLEVALARHVDGLHSRNLTQAALVVLRNSDGAILAMVGSRDYHDQSANGAFNGVTARLRPGSTLKPFVYAAAMEIGDTPATIAYDVVLPEDAGEFYTKDVKSHGFARYRESLAGSYNLSAVHTLQRVGIQPLLSKLRAAGLETLDAPDESYDWGLAIGHAEVRLLDLTAAFSAFGRGGVSVVPRAIEMATNASGETYSEPVRERERIFAEDISYLIFDILSDADARKPMFGDRVPMNLPFPVALKTGTTKAYTDLWAIGATREYTVGVWGGNFDGAPTHQVMSVVGATPLMRAAYTAIAARYGDPTAPERPRSITSAVVCPLSGKLPGPHCEHRKHELFLADNVPTETCDWHREVCGAPGIVFPAEIRSWTNYYKRGTDPATCEKSAGKITIVSPVPGARFLLEPHRPAQMQRPLLAAVPPRPDLRWTIDGEPADTWVPHPGTFAVRVEDSDQSDEVTISYEE